MAGKFTSASDASGTSAPASPLPPTSVAAAQKAQSDAATLVGGSGDAGADVPEASLAEVNFPAKAFYLFSAVGICASSSEARRQIKGGAARLEGEKITDPNQEFASAAELEGKVLQLGKKTFRRLVA